MNTHAISANGLPVDPNTGDVPVVIYQRKTILTDAQIKALTTPVEVVPAPGPGKILNFISSSLISKFTGGVYSSISTNWTGPNIYYGTDGTDGVITADPEAAWIFEEVGSKLVDMLPQTMGRADEVSVYENKPFVINIGNGGSNDLTGGDASNTLEVTVFYSVINL